MPKGYTLEPQMQMKIEDERAGRLDFVYETALLPEEALNRLKNRAYKKLSYDIVTENGILYIDFTDESIPDGLHNEKPLRYAVRFEIEGHITIIRVRYIWDMKPYLFRQDVDDFFCEMLDARVSDREKKIWIDGTDDFISKDPLKIHGNKHFWIIALIFVIVWLFMMLSIR